MPLAHPTCQLQESSFLSRSDVLTGNHLLSGLDHCRPDDPEERCSSTLAEHGSGKGHDSTTCRAVKVPSSHHSLKVHSSIQISRRRFLRCRVLLSLQQVRGTVHVLVKWSKRLSTATPSKSFVLKPWRSAEPSRPMFHLQDNTTIGLA